MLSITTESRLADLIGAIADNERQMELRRQDLAREPLFSPYAAFSFIDKLHSGYLTSYDIKDFLRSNGIIVMIDDTERLLQLYGDRTVPRLYKSNFVDLVLPADPFLRSECFRRSEYEPLGRIAEISLAKLIQTAIDGINKLKYYCSALTTRYDYNLFDAFRTIDRYKSGYITTGNLSIFLKQTGYAARLDDPELFVRALDKDKDGRVSYSEFTDGLIPNYKVESYSKYAFSEKKPSYYRSRFESPEPRIRTEYKERISRFDSVDRYRSTTEYASPTRTRYESPYEAKTTYVSPYKSSYTSYPKKEEEFVTRKIDYYSPSRQSQLGAELAQIMEEQIGYEGRFEQIKEELVVKSDFNLMNGFRVFDFEAKGYATLPEFYDGLKSIGVLASYSQISLLFNRMDADGDGRLKYSDYCYVFAPKRAEYEKIITEKPPYDKTYLIEKYVYFSPTTKMLYKDAFEILLDHERALERIREKLKYFDLHGAFEALDNKGKGQVSLNKLKEFLISNRVYANEAEVTSLLEKYDHNQDGKISLPEFVNELSPKKMY